MSEDLTTPEWARWPEPHELGEYTIGIEEEVMLLTSGNFALANRINAVMPRLPVEVVSQVTPETHGSAVELRTGVHKKVDEAVQEIQILRRALSGTLAGLGLRGAVSGTHPFAVWEEISISAGERYQFVHGSMRELARREPTFALHLHVGIGDPETAIETYNRIRVHLPLLLALSANSPFWQGRDTGLASARTPLVQAFPRVGIPRPFHSYEQYVEEVNLLIKTEAIPDATFLWWDVRPQASLGTIEIRVMDAQTRTEDTAALVALTRCLVKMEAEDSKITTREIDASEVIGENRFLAARDGSQAELISVPREIRVPVSEMVAGLVAELMPHAQELGCAHELEHAINLGRKCPADRQREISREVPSLAQLVGVLADEMT